MPHITYHNDTLSYHNISLRCVLYIDRTSFEVGEDEGEATTDNNNISKRRRSSYNSRQSTSSSNSINSSVISSSSSSSSFTSQPPPPLQLSSYANALTPITLATSGLDEEGNRLIGQFLYIFSTHSSLVLNFSEIATSTTINTTLTDTSTIIPLTASQSSSTDLTEPNAAVTHSDVSTVKPLSSVTHLIVSVDSENKFPQRTMKYLQAIISKLVYTKYVAYYVYDTVYYNIYVYANLIDALLI